MTEENGGGDGEGGDGMKFDYSYIPITQGCDKRMQSILKKVYDIHIEVGGEYDPLVQQMLDDQKNVGSNEKKS